MQDSIQWYPGHMFKAKKELIAQLKNINLIVEIIDSRVPFASHNMMLEELTKNKLKLLIFSKCDLVDQHKLQYYLKKYEEKGYMCLCVNLLETKNSEKLRKKIIVACEELISNYQKKGINKMVRALVMGMPNVGKSTFINCICKKKKTLVGNKPGVTKKQQWINVEDHIQLLDTPGILVPKIEDQNDGFKLVLCSLIKEEIVELEEVAVFFLRFLNDNNLIHVVEERYNIKLYDFDIEEIYNKIAKSCGAILKGNEYDYNRVTKIIINDFRSLKFGKIILDDR